MAAVISARDFSLSDRGNASALILLLEEEDLTVRTTALKSLALIVDDYWPEIADSILKIETLAEDQSFPEHQLAAYIASKCFFHLEEYADALRLAFSAGEHFQVGSASPYVETLIATCIDEYVLLRKRQIDEKESDVTIDPRMEELVNRMFERCYKTKSYMQALGLALESRRIEKMEETLSFSPLNEKPCLLRYAFNTCRRAVKNYSCRLKIIEIIYKAFEKLPQPDYSCICHCLQLLNRSHETAIILESLILSSNLDDVLLAYQIALDLAENEDQKFLLSVHNYLPNKPAVSSEAPAEDSEMKDDDASISEEKWKYVDNVKRILNGEFVTELWLDFLFHSSKSDRVLMKRIQEAVENRSSVLHNAAVVTHAYLNSGTAIDAFLRNNLEWMGIAINWAKFTATASIGVIHKGHTKESMNLLQPYLPQNQGISASKYSEGGALYALGLIHANKSNNETVSNYILAALRNTGADEVVLHGGCLGIGLIDMKTYKSDVYETLLQILMTDNAVSGEAAAFAIGLVMLGSVCTSTTVGSRSVDDIIRELLSYAHETKHEKIIRGLSIGLAFIMYGKESEADGLIEQMIRDKDSIIRYGGAYAIGLAYCGTSNNEACRRLLHIAVSDVNDDVRRAAVLNIGFILIRTPEQVPKLVSLLAESYNSNVRYGACLAVGIACAGTGKNEAVQLLEPMLEDPVDYVRQASYIALSMVLMQSNDSIAATFRDKVMKVINDKHVNVMTKMGAILAQGILNAGGCNVVISCLSHTGLVKMSSIVGIVLWSYYWYWYPCMLSLELAFQPTAMVGLNKDLKIPKEFYVNCSAKKSEFAYPEPLQDKKEEKKERVATAVLSVTGKVKAKKHDKKHENESTELKENSAVKIVEKAEESEKEKNDSAESLVKEKEASGFVVKNMERTLLKQERYLSFDPNQRYVPVSLPRRASGVIILKDKTPELPESVENVKLPIGGSISPEDEAAPPEPFEWKETNTTEETTEIEKEKPQEEKGKNQTEDIKTKSEYMKDP